VHAAAAALGCERSTLKRAIRGLFPNEELVARYRAFVLEYVNSLTLPWSANTLSVEPARESTLSPQQTQQIIQSEK